jgi:energy-coupling factor transporter transmembrane protein EcfT
MFFYVCLAIGLVSLVVFLSQRKPEVTLRVLLVKAVTSVLFILTSFAAFYENENCSTALALLFFAGAVCGLLGDIWLDAKYIFKTEEKDSLYQTFGYQK